MFLGNEMIKRSHESFCAGRLLALALMIGCVSQALAQGADPITERVRRDLGYYRQADKPAEDLAGEVRSLREELHQAIAGQESRIQRLEQELDWLQAKGFAMEQSLPSAGANAASSPVERASLAAAKPARKISVCSEGCDFNDLQKAVDAVPPGGLVTVAAEINGSCAVINKPMRLLGLQKGDGKRAHLAGGICWGKAPLVTAAANIVIDGFEISGAAVDAGNGACIRMDPQTENLAIRNVYCHNSQMGLLGGSKGRLSIEDSIFESTQPGNALSHGMYLSKGDEAVIRRCRIVSTRNAGHSLKSGFQRLIVEDSVIAALNEHNSRAVDAFGGGEIILRRNVIQQGPQSDNSEMIGIALEPKRLLPDGHSFLMEENWVIFDDANRENRILIRAQALGPMEVRNNVFVNLTGVGMDGVKEEGNRWLKTRKEAGLPEYDGTIDSLPKPGLAKRPR